MKKNTPSAKEKDASKRMTVVLPPETARMLEILSDIQSVTLNEAIRRAISTEAYIQKEVQQKSKILVEAEDGQTRELVFR